MLAGDRGDYYFNGHENSSDFEISKKCQKTKQTELWKRTKVKRHRSDQK